MGYDYYNHLPSKAKVREVREFLLLLGYQPSNNALVEAFNSRFRQECLNQHWFLSLEDANAKLQAWQHEYNAERPHSALGYRTPWDRRSKSSNAEATAA